MSKTVKSAEELNLLWDTCEKFIADQMIRCEETIYQTDRVMINAYELIQDICEIVGYCTSED